MKHTSSVRRPRLTSVDLHGLARSKAVRAFMRRVAHEFRDPTTGAVLSKSLCDATANVFGLIFDDGYTIPPALYELADSIAAGER